MDRRPSGWSRSSVSISSPQPCWPPSSSLRFSNRLLNDMLHVDVVLDALVFHEAGLRWLLHGLPVDERSCEHTWIFNLRFIRDRIPLQAVTLGDVILIAGHLHVSRPPDLTIEVADVDD